MRRSALHRALLASAILAAPLTAHAQGMPLQPLPGQNASKGEKPQVEAVLPPSGVGLYAAPLPLDGGKDLAMPRSTQRMTLSGKHIDREVSTAEAEADDRLNGLQLGTGELADPEVAGGKSELQQLRDGEARLRLLKMKEAIADESVKLWQKTYDGRREVAPTTAAPTASAAAVSTTPSAAASAPSAPAEPAGPPDLAELLRQTPPVVTSIVGALPNLHATVLVPYRGEMHVQTGDTLPGGLKVVSIDRNGVTVKRGDETFPLGYGNSVPTSWSAPSAAASGSNGAIHYSGPPTNLR